ncbi:MAG: beta-propeller fold lactonase family protein [Acidobacteriota bacterium]|nr:beta-propeller fold lactonase family protein [Acidobacteriota bacterium]
MRGIVGAVMLLCGMQFAAISGAQQPRLLVAVKGEQKLAIVNPATLKVLGKVDEAGFTGHEVAASPDGKFAFVPVYGNSGVGSPGTNGTKMVKIDLATQKIVGTLDFGHGVRPHCPVFGPKDGMLYVTTELDKTVSVVDPNTMKIVGSIPTGQEQSHMLAISHDGLRGYTANVGPGTVSVLEMKARKLIKVISISGDTQRIAISNDDRWVFTADQTKPQLAVIDTKTLSVTKWIPIDGMGYGGAMMHDGRWFLMTVPKKSEIQVVDLKTMQVARKISTMADPEEVIITPDDKTAWVSSPATGSVAQIDLAKWEMVHKVETGHNSDGLTWAK